MSLLAALPKAELHLHLEGAASPALVRRLAKKYDMNLPDALASAKNGRVAWSNFSEFHLIYEAIAGVLRAEEDFYDLTYAYLSTLASFNTCYSELIISPYVAKANAIPYPNLLQGVVQAIQQARQDFGIEARLLALIDRRFDPAISQDLLETALRHRDEYLVGANLAGDTSRYGLPAFVKIADRLKAEALPLSVHAGEDTPAFEMTQALDLLHARRIGHGVRVVESPDVLKRVIDEQVMLEICPTSNIVLKFYSSYAEHPLHQLKKLGANICLNADDPTFFGASLCDEYRLAQTEFAYTHEDLLLMTRRAIQAAFVDEALKKQLLAKCQMPCLSPTSAA